MNSLPRLARLPCLIVKRYASTSPSTSSNNSIRYSGPNDYVVPFRQPTMDDLMEPYGSWKIAHEREKANANKILAKGIACLTVTCIFFYYSGVMDGLFMPNLDNIMEDTEPFEYDKEGRVTV